jgi:single-strand DNA-binding protein
MYHKVIIVGNLGRDPEMRYMPNGRAVTNFSVATNRRWTNQDGSQGEETVWFRVSTWGKQAEVCNQYLSKGRQVFIEGILRPDPETGGPRVWTGNDGRARASFEVVAQTVKFLGGRGDQVSAGPSSDLEEPPGLVEADDIPF